MYHVLRRVGLDRNPMRRTVDHVEAVATLLLLAALVLGGPALVSNVGQRVYRSGVVEPNGRPSGPAGPGTANGGTAQRGDGRPWPTRRRAARSSVRHTGLSARPIGPRGNGRRAAAHGH